MTKNHKKSYPFSKAKKEPPGDGFGSQLGAKIREKPIPKIHLNFKLFLEAFWRHFPSQNPARGPPKTTQKPILASTPSLNPDFLKMSVSPTRDTHFQGFKDPKILQKSRKNPPRSLQKNSQKSEAVFQPLFTDFSDFWPPKKWPKSEKNTFKKTLEKIIEKSSDNVKKWTPKIDRHQ